MIRRGTVLRQTLQQMASVGPTEREVLRAKRMLLGGTAVRLQRSSGRAAAKMRAAMYGLPSTKSELEIQLATVSRQDVHDAMRRVLGGDGLWVHVMPT